MLSKKKQILFSALLGVILLVVIFIPKRRDIATLDEVELTDTAEVQEIVYKYGIPVDDYEVDYGIVERNQSLSVILEEHGLSARNVYDLGRAADTVFDVRKIRSGQAYALPNPTLSLTCVAITGSIGARTPWNGYARKLGERWNLPFGLPCRTVVPIPSWQ